MSWPLEPQAAVLLNRSHGVTARVLASINGSAFVEPVQLASGSIAVDLSSPVRRSLSCEIVADVDDPSVDAFAAELRVEYGIVDDATARTWWVPVGTFVVSEAVEAGAGVVSVTAPDRWQRIIEARFEQPRTTSGDTVQAIVDLLTEADARIVVDTSRAPTGTHGTSLWERDRDEAITKLAQSIGAVVYFDPMGVAVIARAPALGDAPAWEIGGGDTGVKVSSRRGVSRARTYNAAAVIGEPQGKPPVYAVRRVTSGPLRWGGPFGKRPRFLKSSLIATQAQADGAAAALLARVQGVARTLELESLPNPALDAGDVLAAEIEPGVWQRHIAESFTLPLGLGVMPIATRSDADEEIEGD